MLFEGKDRREQEKLKKSQGLLPPGQSLTLKWPVLHYGSVPVFDPETWDFRVYGLVDEPLRFTWTEFNQLPKVQRTSDFHCVTRWSRFDNSWEGVAFQEVLRRVTLKPGAAFVLVHAEQGFTATSRSPILTGKKFCSELTMMGNRCPAITAILCASSYPTSMPGSP